MISRTNKVFQAGALYGSMILSVILGFGVSIANTRLLGPEQFGDLKFLQSIFMFLSPFISFGIFTTGSRLLALSTEENRQKEILGSLIFTGILFSVAYSLFVALSAFIVDPVFSGNFKMLILITAPFAIAIPLQQHVEKLLIGLNAIYKLAFLTTLPKVFYLLAVVAYIFFVKSLTVQTALIFQLLTLLMVTAALVIKASPDFSKVRHYFPEIIEKNRTHGLPIYYGMLFSVSAKYLTEILIAFFINNESVGYYSLAKAMTIPFSLLPISISQTFYKNFAHSDRIPFRITALTILLSVLSLIAFFLIIKPLIIAFYSEKFLASLPITYVLSIGFILNGFGDYVGRFLGAHGKGVMIRNTAFAVGTVTVVCSVVFVKYFGLTGSAYVIVVSNLTYLGMISYYYTGVKKRLMSATERVEI